MTEHIRKLISEYSEDFYEHHKDRAREHNGHKIRYFDDQLNFFLLGLVEAAIKDGCSREWLLERFMIMADDTLVSGRRRSPELNSAAAKLLLDEAAKVAHMRAGTDKQTAA